MKTKSRVKFLDQRSKFNSRSGEGVEKEWRRSGEGVEKEWRRSGEGVEKKWRRSGEGVEKEWDEGTRSVGEKMKLTSVGEC